MAHEQFSSCLSACEECADACDHCATSCLSEPNVAEMARCIRLDMDCAQVCRLAAGFMARGSNFAVELCETCANVCDACAEECGRHPADHCKRCAEACRRCAEECRRMAGGARGRKSEGARPSSAH